MSFLIGKMKKKIDGRKELSDHKKLITYFKSENIYIPLIHNGKELEILVNEGDYVKVGTLIAQRLDHFHVPVYSSCSGLVTGVEKRLHSSAKMVKHLVIKNDFKFEEEKYESLDYLKATKEQIVDFIKEKGLVGQGGAGFPTYIKYLAADKCETLLINGVECEPYITSDYIGSKKESIALKAGVLSLLKASTAKKCKIAIKSYKVELINSLKELFKDESKVEITGVVDAYPLGWERTLIYELTKKRYKQLPIEVGFIVSNITTAIQLGKSLITGLPPTAKIVTISGEAINNPTNVFCPIGTPVNELIELCGGYNQEEVQLIMGGPMMGTSVGNDKLVIGSANNAVTVVKYQEYKAMGCLRCGTCLDHCPISLQPIHINEAEKVKDLDRIYRLNASQCIECGLCTFVCPSKLALTEGIRRAKKALALRK